jgi:hypothetical protein
MSKLIGTLPKPIMESIRLEPPGKLTVTMTELVDPAITEPQIKIPVCPVPNVVATSYDLQTDPQGGFSKIVWTFMGGVIISGEGDGGGGDGTYATPNEVIELSIGVDQVPLGMHPKIKDILDKFSGTVKEGELTFPEKDPTGASKRKGVDADGNEFALNPFYGVTSFFSPRATFRIRRLNQSGGIAALGKLDDPPLSNLPSTGLSKSATNWIKTSVNRRDHGSTTETTEEWLYSLTGWESKIYSYA